MVFSMTKWAKDATEFTVSVTHNVQNTSYFCYVPKPVLRRLGNPKRIKFTMHDKYITVECPGD